MPIYCICCRQAIGDTRLNTVYNFTKAHLYKLTGVDFCALFMTLVKAKPLLIFITYFHTIHLKALSLIRNFPVTTICFITFFCK